MKLSGLIKITKRLLGVKTEEIVMAKQDIVSAALTAIQVGEQQVLNDAIGVAVDAAYAEQKASDGTVTTPSDQATIDALKAQVADLGSKLSAMTAQDAADVKAGTEAVAALQVVLDGTSKQLSDALAAKQADDSVIGGLQTSVASIRALADQLAAIVLPPAPTPVP